MPSELPANEPEANRPETDRPGIYRLAWIFYLLLAIAGAIWFGSSQGSISLALFFDPASWWVDLALGLLAGLALVVLWDGARRLVPAMGRLEKLLAEHIGPLEPSEAYALALISGFSEELFFRGAVQTSWGFGWATVIFTLMHSGSGRVFRWWTLFAFVAALVFGGLTLYRGSILAAVVAHTVVNAINLRRLASEYSDSLATAATLRRSEPPEDDQAASTVEHASQGEPDGDE